MENKELIIGKVYKIKDIKNEKKEEALKYFEEHLENIDIYKITSDYFELIDKYLELELKNNLVGEVKFGYPILLDTIYMDYETEVNKIKKDMQEKYGYIPFNEGGFYTEYKKRKEYFSKNYVKYVEYLLNLYPDSYLFGEDLFLNSGFPSKSLPWLLRCIIPKEHNIYQYGKKGIDFEELLRLKFPDVEKIEFNDKFYRIYF